MDRKTLLEIFSAIAFTLEEDDSKDRILIMVRGIIFILAACLTDGNEADLLLISNLCNTIARGRMAQTGD